MFNRCVHLSLLVLPYLAILARSADAAYVLDGQAEAYDVAHNPDDLAVGDFNADGFQDLVTVAISFHRVDILWGAAGGSVSHIDSIAYGVAEAPLSCAAADVSGDGIADLIVGFDLGFNPDEIRLYRGSTDGSLLQFDTILAIGQGPTTLHCADLNGDGALDVVSGCYYSNLVSVALNPRGGAIWTIVNLPTVNQTADVAVEDTGQDGLLDIIVGTPQGTVALFRNLGSGQFGPRQDLLSPLSGYHIAVGDINGDGFQDIAVSEQHGSVYEMLWGVAPDSFAAYVYVNTPANDLLIADVNKDARDDLIITNTDGYTLEWDAWAGNEVLVHLQQPNGTLATPWRGVSGNEPLVPTLADMNNDGRLDLVTVNKRSNSISILPGNGDGTFGSTRSAPADTIPSDIAVGDINGDSIPDAVVANAYAGRVTVLLGNGNGTFTTGTPVAAGGETSVVLTDVNSDGKRDLVTADRFANVVSVFLGTGSGTFSSASTFGAGMGPNGLALADLTGDNKPDLVVSNLGTYSYGCDCYQQGDRVAVLKGHGDGTFDVPVYLPTPQGPGAVALADMNGDGKRDILVTTPGGYRNICLCWAGANKLSVFLNNGSGGFSGRIDRSVGLRPVGLATADFNTDGKTDVALAHAGLWDGSSCYCHTGSSVVTLLGNGNGTVTPDTTLTTGASPSSIVVQDLTGDGILDIAAANFVGNTVSFFQGIAPGTFTPKQDIGTDSGPIALRAADLNGDGRTDLLTANQWTYTVSVLMNQSVGPTAVNAHDARGNALRVAATRDGHSFVFDIALTTSERTLADIYDLAGHRIRSLVVEAGDGALSRRAAWAGDDARDRAVPSGVYFLRVRSGTRSAMLKVALIR